MQLVRARVTPENSTDGKSIEVLIPTDAIASFIKIKVDDFNFKYRANFRPDYDFSSLGFKVSKIECDLIEGTVINKWGILI